VVIGHTDWQIRAFDAAIGVRPELAEEPIATVIGKAESTTHRLVEMLYVPAELRVLRALLSMATLEDAPSPVRLTQDELASFAATTRPSANHVLRQQEERGTVALSRGQLMVLDRRRLAERAGSIPEVARRDQTLCHAADQLA
jgi:CRP/FNR family transcriptional regulator, cyclic AMP receptor protein